MPTSADLTTVVVAVLGVAGTLSSPLLAQRTAARARQQEFSLQGQQRREERRRGNRTRRSRNAGRHMRPSTPPLVTTFSSFAATCAQQPLAQ
jgi:hypothetical protein